MRDSSLELVLHFRCRIVDSVAPSLWDRGACASIGRLRLKRSFPPPQAAAFAAVIAAEGFYSSSNKIGGKAAPSLPFSLGASGVVMGSVVLLQNDFTRTPALILGLVASGGLMLGYGKRVAESDKGKPEDWCVLRHLPALRRRRSNMRNSPYAGRDRRRGLPPWH